MSAFPFDKYDEMTKDERVPMSTSTADEHALEDEQTTTAKQSTLGEDASGAVRSTEPPTDEVGEDPTGEE